jgi:putative transposase
MNTHCERGIQSIKTECLDHFVVFGDKHLRYLIDLYLAHYHLERPHQGLGNRPLSAADDPPATLPFRLSEVVCSERLGGLLKHYYRQAA